MICVFKTDLVVGASEQRREASNWDHSMQGAPVELQRRVMIVEGYQSSRNLMARFST
jgi:hypothetical protein